MLKNILLTSLIGFAMLTFVGCTDGKDTASGKCDSAKTVKTKCGEGKCDSAPKPTSEAEKKCGDS